MKLVTADIHTPNNIFFIFGVLFVRSTMTNEGFREYVNGNMLFWAANVKSNEGYKGIVISFH